MLELMGNCFAGKAFHEDDLFILTGMDVEAVLYLEIPHPDGSASP
jgi:hypothetical protein